MRLPDGCRSVLLFLGIALAAPAGAAGPAHDQGACWPEGHVCWDNGGDQSCNQKCCSKSYVQATSGPNKGKDVCTAVTACWQEGHKCWDNNGADSCKSRCCSALWHHDDKKNYDVCDKPQPFADAVVGYGGEVDEEMRQDLQIGKASCWPAGRQCFNNGGRDSCWDNCCSKSYYHDPKVNADVCAPIPADRKCYAQYTPCWDKLPTPKGAYYVEVSNGKKVYYPSCFQCCGRVSANGRTHWPAWTEYYIGDGTHDATSQSTHWFDAFVAGAQGLNPVQGIIDALKPTDPNRQKRGGEPQNDAVHRSIANGYQDYAKKAGKQATVSAAQAGARAAEAAAGRAIGAAGPVGVIAGGAFNFLFGFFSKLTEPKWDLCD